MINLLPDDTKREIQAARMNVLLLRYNLLVLGALGLLAAICLLFYVILQSTQSNAQSTTNDNSVKAESYASVRIAADEYRNNLSIASKVLDNGVIYTSFIFDLSKILPSGVVLEGINLSATDFGNQTTFTARAKSYEKAAELKESFQKSTLFENVYFQNLTDSSAGAGAQPSEYPITVSISAKLKKAVL